MLVNPQIGFLSDLPSFTKLQFNLSILSEEEKKVFLGILSLSRKVWLYNIGHPKLDNCHLMTLETVVNNWYLTVERSNVIASLWLSW